MKKRLFGIFIVASVAMLLLFFKSEDSSQKEVFQGMNSDISEVYLCREIWGAFSKTINKSEVEKQTSFGEMEYFTKNEYLVGVGIVDEKSNIHFCIVYEEIDGEYYFFEGGFIDGFHSIMDFLNIQKGDSINQVLTIDRATQIVEWDDKIYSFHHCKNGKTLLIEYEKNNDEIRVLKKKIIIEEFCFVDAIMENEALSIEKEQLEDG